MLSIHTLIAVISTSMLAYDFAVRHVPRWVRPLRDQLNAAISAGRLTQSALAREAQMSQPAVSQFLDGSTKEPGAQILIAGCKVLGLSIDALVGLRTDATASVPTANPAALAEARRVLERVAAAILTVTAAAEPGRQAAGTGTAESESRTGARPDR